MLGHLLSWLQLVTFAGLERPVLGERAGRPSGVGTNPTQSEQWPL